MANLGSGIFKDRVLNSTGLATHDANMKEERVELHSEKGFQ